MSKSHEDLFHIFEELGISYKNHIHEPAFKVEESQHIKKNIPGAHTKNLFLYNKKEHYFLITMLDDKQLDLKAFEKELGRGRLSFASPRRLMECLKLTPGSVTPYGVMNDESHVVNVILDAEMMEHEILNYHPLQNDMTVSVSNQDFRKFFDYTQHIPDIRALPKV